MQVKKKYLNNLIIQNEKNDFAYLTDITCTGAPFQFFLRGCKQLKRQNFFPPPGQHL
jgi:hypothetical protein